MLTSIGEPREIFVSGGALLHSPAWTQMMADALGRQVQACVEKEATSRGAALLALERIEPFRALAICRRPWAIGLTRVRNTRRLTRLCCAAERLYQKMFEENW